jgi:hypothetical protein
VLTYYRLQEERKTKEDALRNDFFAMLRQGEIDASSTYRKAMTMFDRSVARTATGVATYLRAMLTDPYTFSHSLAGTHAGKPWIGRRTGRTCSMTTSGNSRQSKGYAGEMRNKRPRFALR